MHHCVISPVPVYPINWLLIVGDIRIFQREEWSIFTVVSLWDTISTTSSHSRSVTQIYWCLLRRYESRKQGCEKISCSFDV